MPQGSMFICRHDAPMQCLASNLAGTALVHHANPSGVYQPHRVGMMHECSTSKLLTSAAFVHHADKRAQCIKGVGLSRSIYLSQKADGGWPLHGYKSISTEIISN